MLRSSLAERLKAIVLEDTITSLLPELQRGNAAFVHQYLRSYQHWTSTRKLMELLCRKYIPPPSPGTWPSAGLVLGMPGITLSLSRLCGKSAFQRRTLPGYLQA